MINIDLPNYNLYHTDPTARSGGVAIYVIDSVRVEILSNLSLNVNGCEYIWVKLSLSDIIIGVIYRHSSTNNIKQFLYQMKKNLELLNSKTYLIGGFNINIDQSKCLSKIAVGYINMLNSNGLFHLVTLPTRITNTSFTVIDHIITNDNKYSIFPGIVKTDISDHYPVFCSIDVISSLRFNSRINFRRDLKNFDKDLFSEELHHTLQNRFQSKREINSNNFNKLFTDCWEEFGHRLESNYKSANKVFWQTVRRLRGKRSHTTTSIKDAEGNILSDGSCILSRWREYFEDLLNPVEANNLDTPEVTQHREMESLTAAEVATAIKQLKSGKAAGGDEIRPEMLKSLTWEGILWLTRVCRLAFKLGKTPKDWQTGVIIPIYKKGDHKQCTNYRGISLLSLPGKVYAKCLERRCRQIVEPALEDGQCGFRPGRSTTDQIFTLKQIFEKSWEYAKDLFACFVDLEKAFDRIPREKLWRVLQEYGVDGQLLQAIKSFYCQPEVCVRVNGMQSKPFHVGVGLRQGCVLSPLLFITYMNWIDRRSQASECVKIGSFKTNRLLFADDLVLLADSESGLQRALDGFAAACDYAGMKISTAKTEVLHLSRNPVQCSLQVGGVKLKQVEKFKYLGVAFTSDGKQDEEIDNRISKAGAVMHALHRSVVLKRELSKKAKLAIFRSIFVPILTYGHESWAMTERMRSRVQASEMRFLRRIEGVTLLDKVSNTNVHKSLGVESLLLRIERSQLRWFGHVSRMPQERLPKQTLFAVPNGKRPVGRPRQRWMNHIEDLGWNRLGLTLEEMKEVVEDRDVWRLILELLPPQPSRKSGH